jgi:hypothetical protein
MKSSTAFILTGAVAIALTGYRAFAADEPSAQADGKQPAAVQSSSVPEPITVTVSAVDPKAKTITVHQVGEPVAAPDVKVPVASNASGRELADIKAGDEVALTCEVKPAMPKKNAMAEETHPVLIKDCSKVVKIETTP